MARPRSDEARRKALAAAAELIGERGVTSLSIEEVAARSGVAKTTIYRHWPERTTLIIDTFNAQLEDVGTPDTGSLRGDLDAFFGGMIRVHLSGTVAAILPRLISAAGSDPEIAELVDRIGSERSRVIAAIVGRAERRGELRDEFAALDEDTQVGIIVGPIVFQKLVRRRTVTPDYVRAWLDIVVAGITW